MTKRSRDAFGAAMNPVVRGASVFLAVAALLFLHVWWPIQAERNLAQLKKVESQVFQKKSELNALQDRYRQMTSLTMLDQWAKRDGSWHSPKSDDVIPLR